MSTISPAEAEVALDFPTVAARFFDVWPAFGVAFLVSIAAFVVMRLYVRAISREGQRSSLLPQDAPPADSSRPPVVSALGSLEMQTENPSGAVTPPHPLSPTFQHAETAFRRAARFSVFGGSVHAATSVALLFLFGVYAAPLTQSWLTILGCYGAVFWSWSCITMIALALFSGPKRRLRWFLVFVYVGVLAAMGMLLELARAPALPFADVGMMPVLLRSLFSTGLGQSVAPEELAFPPHLQPILFWILSGVPFTFVLVFFNRFVRGTVGPLFINLALMTILSTFVIMDLILGTSPGVWLVGHIKQIFGGSTQVVLTVISLALSSVFAWFGLVWIANRYRRRLLSDQTFLFDALWLSASLCVSLFLLNKPQFCYLLGLLPFVLYKITVGYGLKRLAAEAALLPKARLLFLRVFGSTKRSEKLFDLLAARWRYAGSIQLISAMDVARSRFEPDEFLDFVTGRLANAYIGTGTDLDRRLALLDSRPDPDGRFRVNEFFCRVDTWQPTVTRLMGRSDLVAMDLRSFTSERLGCIFELGALINQVPLHRVALLIDNTTDEQLLKRTLDDLWQTIEPQSPNAKGEIVRLRMIDLTCGHAVAVNRLMQLGDEALLAAAKR